MQLLDVVDRTIWNPSNSGIYSVKSMYEVLRISVPRVNWDRLIWAKYIPPKYSFCLWLVFRNAVKTRTMLSARGVDMDTTFILCNKKPEDCQHLFFDCLFTREAWKAVFNWCGINRRPFK